MNIYPLSDGPAPPQNDGDSYEPGSKKDFGRLIRNIIGGDNAHVGNAAERLVISRPELSKILAGTRNVSLNVLTNNKWREVFAEYYPENWAKYQVHFEKMVAVLTPRIPQKKFVPENPDTFAYVIWNIIGGHNADRVQAANNLGITWSELGEIIRGRWNPSQDFLKTKKWREILAKNYPEDWKKYEPDYERVVAKLLPVSRRAPQEPENKESFGYVLWNILGGENAQLTQAAKRLKIRMDTLSAIIHDRSQPSQRLLINKKWRKVFAKYYSQDWAKQETDFEKHAALLPIDNLNHCKEPENKESPGHLLWQSLGGPHSRIGEAAKFMGISVYRLHRIIHGITPFPTKKMVEKNWEGIIAEHYPEGWYNNRPALKKSARRSKPKSKINKKQTPRKAASENAKPHVEPEAAVKRRKPRAEKLTVEADSAQGAPGQSEPEKKMTAHEMWCKAAGTFFRELRSANSSLIEIFSLAGRSMLAQNESDDINLSPRLTQSVLMDIYLEGSASEDIPERTYAIRAQHLLNTFVQRP